MTSVAQKKKRVLVLEDQGARIDWLRKYFGKHIEVVWCTSVDIFVEQLDNPHDLVILDHDLHLALPDSRTTQPTGADAAKSIEKDVPVVIWSINRSGALNIHSILRRKGIDSTWVPFGSDELHLINVLVKALK